MLHLPTVWPKVSGICTPAPSRCCINSIPLTMNLLLAMNLPPGMGPMLKSILNRNLWAVLTNLCSVIRYSVSSIGAYNRALGLSLDISHRYHFFVWFELAL
uniref:Secreted protein n=1 Tax=Macrostomum lignano TaxID=282301 RepID=A0A1I8JQ00_9PLAT